MMSSLVLPRPVWNELGNAETSILFRLIYRWHIDWWPHSQFSKFLSHHLLWLFAPRWIWTWWKGLSTEKKAAVDVDRRYGQHWPSDLVNGRRWWDCSFLGQQQTDCSFPVGRRPFYNLFHHALKFNSVFSNTSIGLIPEYPVFFWKDWLFSGLLYQCLVL